MTFPTGTYELKDIEKLARKFIPSLSITPNHATLHCEITADEDLDLRETDSIGKLLGFHPRVLYREDGVHKSDTAVAILKTNVVRVECNITVGAYFNNQEVHTIHEFFPTGNQRLFFCLTFNLASKKPIVSLWTFFLNYRSPGLPRG